MRVPAAAEGASCCRPSPSLRWAPIRLGSSVGTESIGALNDLVFRIANSLQVTFHATGFARLADAPAMPDQLMRKNDPLVPRNNLHEVLLDFLGIRVACEVQPRGEALHMSIDDDSRGNPEGRPEHN